MGTIERTPADGASRALGLIATCLLTGGLATGTAQSAPQPLRQLTVPAKVLPAGCALEPSAVASAPAGRLAIRTFSGTPFPANPWAGTEPRHVATVRAAIDPSPRSGPDGPPLDVAAAAEFKATRAENVVEAYRAFYVAAGGHRIEVVAITFDDAMLVRPEPVSALTNPPRGMRSRFVRGATVAVVSAPTPDTCARAIEAHVRSLM